MIARADALHLGDCLDILPELEDNSVDAIVTDPPAGINFMGKDWDKDKGGRDAWIGWMTTVSAECLRVLKPGGHALVWALPRTSHWTATAWENAGFEVRDRVSHLFGSGFPKSLDVGKHIDKAAGAEREVVGHKGGRYNSLGTDIRSGHLIGGTLATMTNLGDITAPATPEAQQWDGWGTALKPAMEDWWLLRKPLSEKTVAANVLKWGTGALNIDASRVPTNGESVTINTWDNGAKPFGDGAGNPYTGREETEGRWPAHLVHDGSAEVLAGFPETTSGSIKAGRPNGTTFSIGGELGKRISTYDTQGDSGSAARFFKCCPPDEVCQLCLTPKHGIMNAWKNTLVNNVEKNGWTTQAITEFTARLNVAESQCEQLAQLVSSAVNLCETCGTFIAVALAGIKNLDFSQGELQVILDYIGSYKNSTLTQNLALSAELWGNTDTIQTTTSLLRLFGFASPVITKSTQETKKSEPKRFLYAPKPSKAERDAGLDGMEARLAMRYGEKAQGPLPQQTPSKPVPQRNHHPTVKAQALMRWLLTLITPPGGIVLDPFMGSGSTGCACVSLGFDFIGIDNDEDYFDIAEARIKNTQPPLF